MPEPTLSEWRGIHNSSPSIHPVSPKGKRKTNKQPKTWEALVKFTGFTKDKVLPKDWDILIGYIMAPHFPLLATSSLKAYLSQFLLSIMFIFQQKKITRHSNRQKHSWLLKHQKPESDDRNVRIIRLGI